MKKHFLVLCGSLVFGGVPLFACTSEATRPQGFGTATEPAPEVPQETPGASSSSTKDAGAKKGDDEKAPRDAGNLKELPTNDAGCLTYAAAQAVCGSSSDKTVCDFAVECGASNTAGQCSINCEMQSTVACFSQSDAQCLVDATVAKSCSALAACKWKL